MMDPFESAFALLLQHEGSQYTDDPADRGGATKYGITARAYGGDVRDLTLDQAKAWYRREYWDRLHLDQVREWKVAAVLLDQAVNRGAGTCIKVAQEALGVAADGVMGPGTLKTINAEKGLNTGLLVVQHGILSYAAIAQANPTQLRFLKGWEDRCCSLLDFLFRI